jgi:hypothetical protein
MFGTTSIRVMVTDPKLPIEPPRCVSLEIGGSGVQSPLFRFVSLTEALLYLFSNNGKHAPRSVWLCESISIATDSGENRVVESEVVLHSSGRGGVTVGIFLPGIEAGSDATDITDRSALPSMGAFGSGPDMLELHLDLKVDKSVR